MISISTTIHRIQKLTKEVLEIQLHKPDNFGFIAGQFVQVSIPHEGKIIKRSYSISSIPSDSYIEFCIKIIPGGVASTFFVNAHEGDEMHISPPLGRFVAEKPLPLLCIATNVGITPVVSIIRNQLEQMGNTQKIHLLFGFRYAQDIFWQERLDKLAKKFSNFSYEITVSRADETWRGSQGRVTNHLDNISLHVFQSIYICGNPEMIKEVRGICLNRGYAKEQIHFEAF